MVLGIESARYLTYRLAWLKAQGVRRARRESSIAKLYASEMAFRAASDAVQIHGAYGASEEYVGGPVPPGREVPADRGGGERHPPCPGRASTRSASARIPARACAGRRRGLAPVSVRRQAAVRREATVRRRPSSRVTRGGPAEDIAGRRVASSRLRRCSPGRAGPCRASAVDARRGSEPLEEGHDRGFDPGADVDGAARLGSLEREPRRLGHVADVHVVTRLEAVAVDDARLAPEQAVGEDGDDTRLSVRVLAWVRRCWRAGARCRSARGGSPSSRGRAPPRPSTRRRGDRAAWDGPRVSGSPRCRRSPRRRWTRRRSAALRSAGSTPGG